jgi:predicted RNase H-like HicB family nuclease
VRAKGEFTVVIERDEDGYYVAHVPTLDGCYTQASNLTALMKNIREAIELCLEDGDSPVPTEFVGLQCVKV